MSPNGVLVNCCRLVMILWKAIIVYLLNELECYVLKLLTTCILFSSFIFIKVLWVDSWNRIWRAIIENNICIMSQRQWWINWNCWLHEQRKKGDIYMPMTESGKDLNGRCNIFLSLLLCWLRLISSSSFFPTVHPYTHMYAHSDSLACSFVRYAQWFQWTSECIGVRRREAIQIKTIP